MSIVCDRDLEHAQRGSYETKIRVFLPERDDHGQSLISPRVDTVRKYLSGILRDEKRDACVAAFAKENERECCYKQGSALGTDAIVSKALVPRVELQYFPLQFW